MENLTIRFTNKKYAEIVSKSYTCYIKSEQFINNDKL